MLYFRQLYWYIGSDSLLFIRWNDAQKTGGYGMTNRHIADKLDEGGWEWSINNNKLSFKLEIIK